jgi:hypothetical protein
MANHRQAPTRKRRWVVPQHPHGPRPPRRVSGIWIRPAGWGDWRGGRSPTGPSRAPRRRGASAWLASVWSPTLPPRAPGTGRQVTEKVAYYVIPATRAGRPRTGAAAAGSVRPNNFAGGHSEKGPEKLGQRWAGLGGLGASERSVWARGAVVDSTLLFPRGILHPASGHWRRRRGQRQTGMVRATSSVNFFCRPTGTGARRQGR